MKVTHIPGSALSDDLALIWRMLIVRNPALTSPYFCPEFAKAVASVRSDVEIAVMENDGKIVGFFPYQREREIIGRPVGGIISDYHGIICDHDLEFCAVDVLKRVGLSSWEFDHLPLTQHVLARF